ncbi:hypothetical protein BY996DRAFT_6418015 [Phakopsora pachyrhizi]|nr:hypothetical protein BY996DRAFT_6418015 [Phakopsora pachyrhizi]
MGGHSILPLEIPKLDVPPVSFRIIKPADGIYSTDSAVIPVIVDPSNKHLINHGYNSSTSWELPRSYIRWVQPGEEELDRRCEYDMDEQDQEWLNLLNADRKKMGHEPVSCELFEIVMDRLEKEWFNLSRKLIKPDANLMASEDSRCAICEDGDTENSNAIVFCDGCNLAVHQDCYGVPYIPEGQWLCRKCTECELCPNTYGAFKQTSENKWAHLLCAIHIPETGVGNAMYMEPIDGVRGIPKQRWKLKCYICKKNVGACIQCANRNCFTAYHPTCAQDSGLYLKLRPSAPPPGGPSATESLSGQPSERLQAEGVNTSRSFCDKHTPRAHIEALQAAAEARTANLKNQNSIDSQSPNGCERNDESSSQSQHSGSPKNHNLSLITVSPKSINTLKDLQSLRALATGSHSSKSSRAYRLTYSAGPPLVPDFVFQRVFINMICRYWSLKREVRRGAPLLKRLHLEVFFPLVQDNIPWTAANPASHQNQEDRRRRYDLLVGVRDDLQQVKNLVAMICKREKQKFFLYPVLAADVPDYHEIIKHPMDWTTIQRKLESYEYLSVSDMVSDIQLTLTNSRIYNHLSTPYHKAAVRVAKAIEPLVNELVATEPPSAIAGPTSDKFPNALQRNHFFQVNSILFPELLNEVFEIGPFLPPIRPYEEVLQGRFARNLKLSQLQGSTTECRSASNASRAPLVKLKRSQLDSENLNLVARKPKLGQLPSFSIECSSTTEVSKAPSVKLKRSQPELDDSVVEKLIDGDALKKVVKPRKSINGSVVEPLNDQSLDSYKTPKASLKFQGRKPLSVDPSLKKLNKKKSLQSQGSNSATCHSVAEPFVDARNHCITPPTASPKAVMKKRKKLSIEDPSTLKKRIKKPYVPLIKTPEQLEEEALIDQQNPNATKAQLRSLKLRALHAGRIEERERYMTEQEKARRRRLREYTRQKRDEERVEQGKIKLLIGSRDADVEQARKSIRSMSQSDVLKPLASAIDQGEAQQITSRDPYRSKSEGCKSQKTNSPIESLHTCDREYSAQLNPSSSTTSGNLELCDQNSLKVSPDSEQIQFRKDQISQMIDTTTSDSRERNCEFSTPCEAQEFIQVERSDTNGIIFSPIPEGEELPLLETLPISGLDHSFLNGATRSNSLEYPTERRTVSYDYDGPTDTKSETRSGTLTANSMHIPEDSNPVVLGIPGTEGSEVEHGAASSDQIERQKFSDQMIDDAFCTFVECESHCKQTLARGEDNQVDFKLIDASGSACPNTTAAGSLTESGCRENSVRSDQAVDDSERQVNFDLKSEMMMSIEQPVSRSSESDLAVDKLAINEVIAVSSTLPKADLNPTAARDVKLGNDHNDDLNFLPSVTESYRVREEPKTSDDHKLTSEISFSSSGQVAHNLEEDVSSEISTTNGFDPTSEQLHKEQITAKIKDVCSSDHELNNLPNTGEAGVDSGSYQPSSQLLDTNSSLGKAKSKIKVKKLLSPPRPVNSPQKSDTLLSNDASAGDVPLKPVVRKLRLLLDSSHHQSQEPLVSKDPDADPYRSSETPSQGTSGSIRDKNRSKINKGQGLSGEPEFVTDLPGEKDSFRLFNTGFILPEGTRRRAMTPSTTESMSLPVWKGKSRACEVNDRTSFPVKSLRITLTKNVQNDEENPAGDESASIEAIGNDLPSSSLISSASESNIDKSSSNIAEVVEKSRSKSPLAKNSSNRSLTSKTKSSGGSKKSKKSRPQQPLDIVYDSNGFRIYPRATSSSKKFPVHPLARQAFQRLSNTTRVPDEGYIEDGTLAKVPGHNWFPAEVGLPSHPQVPHHCLGKNAVKADNKLLVMFFDTHRTWQWVPRMNTRYLGECDELDSLLSSEAFVQTRSKLEEIRSGLACARANIALPEDVAAEDEARAKQEGQTSQTVESQEPDEPGEAKAASEDTRRSNPSEARGNVSEGMRSTRSRTSKEATTFLALTTDICSDKASSVRLDDNRDSDKLPTANQTIATD